MLTECRTLGGCDTGAAKATGGYNLPARYVIHTVGPVYGDHHGHDAELLASCYTGSLTLAAELGARTIAFPSISTGVDGYPKEDAASIAVGAIEAYFPSHRDSSITRVQLVAFSEADAKVLAVAERGAD